MLSVGTTHRERPDSHLPLLLGSLGTHFSLSPSLHRLLADSSVEGRHCVTVVSKLCVSLRVLRPVCPCSRGGLVMLQGIIISLVFSLASIDHVMFEVSLGTSIILQIMRIKTRARSSCELASCRAKLIVDYGGHGGCIWPT